MSSFAVIAPLLLLIAANFICQFCSAQQPQRQIAYLQCIWRHGDRAPNKLPYPNDPYDESYWPRGWSQLTNLGMQQMREVGQFLRERYIQNMTFLNARFDRDEIFVLSSDSDRALTSAQALLNGMYPPMDSNDQFSLDLNWQPLPVHSTGPNHELLKPTKFECPAYENLRKAVKKHLEDHLSKTYKEFLEFLSTNVYNTTKLISVHEAAKLHDIEREVIHEFDQPAWVNQRWPQYGNMTTLELAMDLKRQERVNDFKHPQLAYLRGGFLLGDWLKRARMVANGESNPLEAEKAVLYSAHDGTLQALLHAMGVADDQMVPYAATICMEVHKDANGTYLIDMLYRHSGQVRPLKICGCKMENCPVETALQILRKRAIFLRKQLYKDCRNEENYCELRSTLDDSD